jgi:TRAP-type C4-dicarboxylate transport system substrate-binding protein
MKKLSFMALALVLVTLIIISGCASSTPAPVPSAVPSAAPSSSPAASSIAKPAATAAPSSTSSPAKVIELRFAHQNPPLGWTTVKFLNAWAKKVEEVTNGRVKVTMYPAESLARATESMDAVKSGLCDITWVLLGYYPGRYNLATVIDLPFIALPEGHLNGKLVSGGGINSHIFQELYDTFPEIQAEFSDVHLLMFNTTEAKFLLSTKKPIRNQADLKGLKIRELGGIPSDMWKLLGASPMLMGAPDIFDAAQKGVLDMVNQNWASIMTYKFYQVFKYYTDAPLGTAGMMTVMNKETWNSLPPDIQKQISSISGIAGADFAGNAAWGFDVKDAVLAAMEKENYKMEKVNLDAGELEKWKEVAGKPLWDKWVGQMTAKNLPGQKVLAKAFELLDKYK